MKLLWWISLIIVFISVFSILIIVNTVMKKNLECLTGVQENCDYKTTGPSFIIGLALITMFVIVALGAIYYMSRSSGKTELLFSQPAQK